MTVSLDGETLDCKSLGEASEVVARQWDAWINGVFKRQVKVRGIVRAWVLDCVENNVAWASSLAKRFEVAAEGGWSVAFTVSDEVRVISTSVYILAVAIQAADLAGKNIRYFTLTLQEA